MILGLVGEHGKIEKIFMEISSFPHKRINVIGTTSSGKSTLAGALGMRLAIPYIELDALYWNPNWAGTDDESFREKVETAIRSPRWVVAGNYSRVRNLIWSKAEAIVWLDYPFSVVFWRLLTRTVRRAVTQEELWNGNRDKFWRHLKLWSDESLFKWLFKTYWRRKREIPLQLQQREYQHLQVFHFKSPCETERWLDRLAIQ